MNQYEVILNQVIGEHKNLFGKSANVTIPFEGQKKFKRTFVFSIGIK